MRALITSVEFSDLLRLTLPKNRHHFEQVMVVTTPTDLETVRVARNNGCIVHPSTRFHDKGAAFNKFAAVEHALEHREWHQWRGWLAFLDADIVWPTVLPVSGNQLQQGYLYSFRRRRLHLDVTQPVPEEEEWSSLPLDPQLSEILGFTQIFHTRDPHLGKPPWHRLDLPTAGLGDSYFQYRWPHDKKVWLDGEVLHIGEYAQNWCGRVTPYTDGTLHPDAEKRRVANDEVKLRWWGCK